jgi:23S rRNA pseudouridine2457 synthase
MARLVLLNKPFAVLCQFSAKPGRVCLKDFVKIPGIYPAGRLDFDSEGLVILTDDGRLQGRISDPRHRLAKVYWAQVEGEPGESDLAVLRAGVLLGEFPTRQCKAELLPAPEWLWPREPPIRRRLTVPTSWLRLELTEGKNRQVRRMTAAVGHPTLRLIRTSIGPWSIAGLSPGQWRMASSQDPAS